MTDSLRGDPQLEAMLTYDSMHDYIAKLRPDAWTPRKAMLSAVAAGAVFVASVAALMTAITRLVGWIG